MWPRLLHYLCLKTFWVVFDVSDYGWQLLWIRTVILCRKCLPPDISMTQKTVHGQQPSARFPFRRRHKFNFPSRTKMILMVVQTKGGNKWNKLILSLIIEKRVAWIKKMFHNGESRKLKRFWLDFATEKHAKFIHPSWSQCSRSLY